MADEPAKEVKRQEDGTFAESGNIKGSKNGYKKLKTRLLEEKLATCSHDPLQALIDVAVDKDTPLDIKVRVNMDLMGFLYPKRKPQSDSIELPLDKIGTFQEISEAQSVVLLHLCKGSISPDNAKLVSDLFDSKRQALATEDLEERLIALENENKGTRRR